MDMFIRHLRYVAKRENFQSVVKNWVTLLGIGVTAKLLLQGSVAIYRSHIRAPLDLKSRYGTGSYALITGGAQGIGLEFAKRLVKQGFNIIIMDKDVNLLENAKNELQLLFQGVTVITEQVDFGPATTYDKYRELLAKFAHLDIGILINNVGVGVGSFGIFDQTPVSLIHSSFFVNLYPAVFFTKLFLEKNQDRKSKSLIINMSSLSGISPLPYFFQYGSSKKFYLALSESLRVETQLENINVDIVDFTPSFISTALTGHRKGLFVIKTNQFVDSAIRAIGQENNTLGHWVHKFERSLFHLFGSRPYQMVMRKQQEPYANSITQAINSAIQNAAANKQQ